MSKQGPLPPAAELRRIFSYDPETGALTWRMSPSGNVRSGEEAGCVSGRGYRQVRICRRRYYVHRIIWAMMTGDGPAEHIDHRDGDRTNNRWANLRAASPAENARNRRLVAGNTSGVKGVSWYARARKWQAQIREGRHRIFIGYFTSLDEAARAIEAAREKYHGEFARSS